MWVESPHRERQQSAKSWGYGGKAPVAGHHPALSAHCTAGILSLSIATRPDRAAAPKAPSTFGGGAPSYNALKNLIQLLCHGRGRGFESRRPRHSFEWLTVPT